MLENILKYKMTDDESHAFKIALLWINGVKKEFPNHRSASFGKSDPRKSYLFKVCYTLYKETKSYILEEEYEQYINANLIIFKSFNNDNIDPKILLGDKAWVRWKIWKKKYEKATPQSSENTNKEQNIKIIAGLEKTKRLFLEILGKIPQKEDLKKLFLENKLIKWVAIGKISPYYVLLCQELKEIIGNLDGFGFDLNVYAPSINEEIIKEYNKLFKGE